MSVATRALGGIAIASLAACAGPRPVAAPPATVAWPAPPSPARVRFVVNLPAPRPAPTGFWHQVVRVLTGLDDRPAASRLVRPHGVAVGSGLVWVADPDAGALWRVEQASGDLRAIECEGPYALSTPVGVTAGGGGVVYVADSGAGRVVAVTDDGKCVAAAGAPDLERPTGVAWDAAHGRLVVADVGRHQVILLSADLRPLGTIGERGDTDGSFNFPTHVTVTAGGDILVVDALNFVVQRFDADGRFLGKFGAPGDAAGYFNKPKGIASDREGNVYVADALQDEVFIFAPDGQLLMSFGRGADRESGLSMPTGVTLGADDRIYVADSLHHRVQVFERVREVVP